MTETEANRRLAAVGAAFILQSVVSDLARLVISASVELTAESADELRSHLLGLADGATEIAKALDDSETEDDDPKPVLSLVTSEAVQ